MDGKTDWVRVEKLLEQMIAQQEKKVLEWARRSGRKFTPEDLRNPQDFSELEEDPVFQYEDGILAGLLSALSAVRAEKNAQ